MIVPDAKVVLNRALRGNLAFLAQEPARFRGSVQVSGNELVTIAVHEEGYALRYKLDAIPAGFYHGPRSECAIQAVLGIAISQEDLVAAVLGGAPVIAGPHEILSQGWDTGAGVEKLVIANPGYVEELRFTLTKGSWQFVGARLWRRDGAGKKADKLWQLDHEGLYRVGDAMLPEKTSIRSPGKRNDNLVVISYRERDLDPPFAKSTDDGGVDGGATTGADAGGWDDGNDAWEGEEDDSGWEGNETPAKPGEAGKPDEAAKAGGPAKAPDAASAVEESPVDAPKPPAAKPALPPVFVIDAGGLKDRGDLCK